jgi:hypothetical protein
VASANRDGCGCADIQSRSDRCDKRSSVRSSAGAISLESAP